jgi:hypothetical protein
MKARTPHPITLAAFLLTIIGIGNIHIGRSQGAYYEKAISRTTVKTKEPAQSVADTVTLARMTSRRDFYALVYDAGLCLLGAGAALFIVAATKRRS